MANNNVPIIPAAIMPKINNPSQSSLIQPNSFNLKQQNTLLDFEKLNQIYQRSMNIHLKIKQRKNQS